jgi:urocanate hydratase
LFAEPIPPAALAFILQVEGLYDALMRTAEPGADLEPSLGGKLLYAGELDGNARALLVAGNIAGAASLAATADSAVQKQAIRDSVADFAVNSLDETLRILKNEIRKREPVAVCIVASPLDVERGMIERGVLPDLLPTITLSRAQDFDASWDDVAQIGIPRKQDERTLITWRVGSAPAQWLPKLEAIAMDLLQDAEEQDAAAARRWLRLAPRYLGRLSQGVRVLRCYRGTAMKFVSRVQSAVDRGEIGVPVEIRVDRHDGIFFFCPA